MHKVARFTLMALLSFLLPLLAAGFYIAQGRYYLGALGLLVVLINCMLQWRRRVPVRFNQAKGGRRG